MNSQPKPEPPASLALRPATPADALCLGVLATQVFLDTYAPEGIRPALANEALNAFSTHAFQVLLAQPQTFIWVAEVKQHLVGFAQVSLGTAQALVVSPAPAELDRLYVQEPFTRRGVGTALIGHAQAEAARLGADTLWLTPWVGNARALRFYAKHRYVDLGATWFEMGQERHQNRVLALRLS
jgi:diamine N-acetyltransferase